MFVFKRGLAATGILLLSVFSGISRADLPVELSLNKSTLINLKKPVERVAVVKPEIADVEVISPIQIQINGLSTGATTLMVWEKGEQKPSFYEVRVNGDISQIGLQLLELSPDDPINAEFARDTIILSGKASNQRTITKAVEIALAYAPKVLNHIELESPNQVLLQVKVAQVDKTALKKLGISALMKGKTSEGFSNLVSAPSNNNTSNSGSVTGIAGNAAALAAFNPLDAFTLGISYFPSGIGAVIQALSTKGLAKILAEPNLLVKSGEEGDFLAGSKIPYTVLISQGGSTTTSIVFQDVGVKLKFKPELMENGLIHLKIDPAEVSSIAGTMAVNGYPIIDIREVRTSVELKEGESLVLAGLLQEETIKNMSKIPWVGDIPIIGAFFRATDNELTEKELVFFITPTLIKPNPPGTKTVLPTDKPLSPEEEKELKWMPTVK